FRVIRGLITNFHQPQSTLLLLIAAIMKADWKKTYETALNKGYRFLSYGDGSLLFIS
ncbi:MAG: S-adenosylmethionine:tRNA ribosyltransferase-isomerase, partial [Chitinophagia bacterium]